MNIPKYGLFDYGYEQLVGQAPGGGRPNEQDFGPMSGFGGTEDFQVVNVPSIEIIAELKNIEKVKVADTGTWVHNLAMNEATGSPPTVVSDANIVPAVCRALSVLGFFPSTWPTTSNTMSADIMNAVGAYQNAIGISPMINGMVDELTFYSLQHAAWLVSMGKMLPMGKNNAGPATPPVTSENPNPQPAAGGSPVQQPPGSYAGNLPSNLRPGTESWMPQSITDMTFTEKLAFGFALFAALFFITKFVGGYVGGSGRKSSSGE